MPSTDIQHQLINWYSHRHPGWQLKTSNRPASEDSLTWLKQLESKLLAPIAKEFGNITITYGFTSHELIRKVLKESPAHIAPDLDQHAAHEVNTKGTRICKRDGAACDTYIDGFENQMQVIARYIIENLEFDRLYFYGSSRPLHISVGPKKSHFVQLMTTRADGKRHPGKRGVGKDALKLIEISE
ncbi:hypothetical protein BIZ37_20975 [Photobacterium sp. BZF1]|uniref:hypothetical protein n=1 Tax=Photobacterium sp. BZF1 TaxID=1904457 RepID=UPI001653B928|nr:hypothetical protein [Photobacterium sp. BZF1]MBC7005041.1 hypothetical protein [Photobacterium sp. BZF1]